MNFANAPHGMGDARCGVTSHLYGDEGCGRPRDMAHLQQASEDTEMYARGSYIGSSCVLTGSVLTPEQAACTLLPIEHHDQLYVGCVRPNVGDVLATIGALPGRQLPPFASLGLKDKFMETSSLSPSRTRPVFNEPSDEPGSWTPSIASTATSPQVLQQILAEGAVDTSPSMRLQNLIRLQLDLLSEDRSVTPPKSPTPTGAATHFVQQEQPEHTCNYPEQCNPCKFHRSAKGCKDGSKCAFCHQCKWTRRTRAKKETTKNPRAALGFLQQ